MSTPSLNVLVSAVYKKNISAIHTTEKHLIVTFITTYLGNYLSIKNVLYCTEFKRDTEYTGDNITRPTRSFAWQDFNQNGNAKMILDSALINKTNVTPSHVHCNRVYCSYFKNT